MDLHLDEKINQRIEHHNKIKDMVLSHNNNINNNVHSVDRLNEKLIELFEELSRFMVKRGEPFKSRAYHKATEIIVLHKDDITPNNYKQLETLTGIGNAIINKIGEYVKTGKLEALEKERSNPINIFTDIYGVGPKKANDIIQKGIVTIKELREKQDDNLNSIQKVGLKYYDDILQRIPRSEIEDFHKKFNQTFENTKDDDTKYEIVGSYRRNATTSGDIDIIITSNNKEAFKRFIDSLVEQGIILEILSRGPTKSLVIAKLPDTTYARRVDFLYTSAEEYPFAILYFTGSKIFNTVMRGRALTMGYSLNEHGMYKMDGKQKGDKVNNVFIDELSIFQFLKMKYKEPEERKDGRSVITDTMESPSKINVPVTIKSPKTVIIKKKTRKIRVSSEEIKVNKENVRIEKERVHMLMRQQKNADIIAQKEYNQSIKDLVNTQKQNEKVAAAVEKQEAIAAKKIAISDAKTKKKRVMLESKQAANIKKEEDKTRKKREMLESKQAAERKKKSDTLYKNLEIIALKQAANIKKEEDKTKKKRETLESKQAKQNNNLTRKKTNSENKLKSILDTNKMKDSDTTLHAIQHFKDGGISVLEGLNQKMLNQMLIKSNEVYRNLKPNQLPLISDNQYDILEDFIKQKFPDNNVVGKIGAPVEKNKTKLPYEMASMDKIKPDTKALPAWKLKYKGDYVLSCKLDGVSGLYSTENNTSKLYTRGDGKIGQDVSHYISYLNLPTKSDVVVRGEFIMSKSKFISKYANNFANGRNMVAGTINRLSVNDTINDIDFVAYEVIRPSLKPSEQMTFLKNNGFITVRNETYPDITNDKLSEVLIDWRKNYDYEIDGVIVSNNQIYPRSSGNPDHSFAFKMVLSDQIAETKVLDVEWNMSKHGYFKPRVRLEPIHLGGVKIEYATGFNGAFIESNRIGVGALIQIIRSGDVIPYIKNVITPAEHGLMPTVPYIWNNTHVDIMLENTTDNMDVRNKNIAGFFKGIEVEGLGEGNINRIIEAGFDSIPKILQMSKTDLLTVDGFKTKMADKIYVGIHDRIEKSSLITIMTASNTLGRGFSGKKIDLVMQKYPDILTSNEDNNIKEQQLTSVPGISSKTAKLFIENLPRFLSFMEDCGLMDKIKSPKTPIVNNSDHNANHTLYNKSIAMSGSRDKELETILKTFNVNISSSVSGNTFALITPDVDGISSKIVSAKKHNIPIFTPSSFRIKYIL
jgi:NAD-dependent DNA ligase